MSSLRNPYLSSPDIPIIYLYRHTVVSLAVRTKYLGKYFRTSLLGPRADSPSSPCLPYIVISSLRLSILFSRSLCASREHGHEDPVSKVHKMPSFELKPMGSRNRKTVGCCDQFTRGSGAYIVLVPQIDEVVWTYSRDVLPPPLINGNVSIDIWQETFDAVRDLMRQQYDLERRYFKGLSAPPICGIIPGVVCFLIAKQIKATREREKDAGKQERAWLELVSDLNRMYVIR